MTSLVGAAATRVNAAVNVARVNAVENMFLIESLNWWMVGGTNCDALSKNPSIFVGRKPHNH